MMFSERSLKRMKLSGELQQEGIQSAHRLPAPGRYGTVFTTDTVP